MKLRVLLILSFIFCFQQLFSQKQEVEKRIPSAEVPAKATDWIDKINIKKRRLKWYFEITSGKKSYEAKFVHDHHLYSLEFDTLGNIEDIEVLTKKGDLEESILNSIETSLDKKFEKFNIVKIQLQYTSSTDQELLDWINDKTGAVTKHYEIEFEAKLEGVWRMFEGTFDAKGSLIYKREIIIRSTENLNY